MFYLSQTLPVSRYLHSNIHSSIIHNSQKMEITQMSIKGLMNKQNVLHTYTGIFLSLKKEGHFDTCYNIDEL